MIKITPQIAKAIDIAAAFVERELRVRLKLNPQFCKDELWAAVTVDGRILIGTPLIRHGEGMYVDHEGRSMAA